MQQRNVFTLLDSVAVPMRDGTLLSTDIWLPDQRGHHPVLLQRTPYRKETPFGSQYINSLEFQSALRRGYAVVIQDTRGRYASEGEFQPFEHEAEDGADTIAWLRSQPFCNGSVGMFGASYVGATQVLLLSENPEGLLAIAPQLTTARHGETWTYRGGALELAFVLLWIIESLGADHLDHRLAEMPPEAMRRARDLLSGFQQDPVKVFERLPVMDTAIEELAPYLKQWLDQSRISGEVHDDHLEWVERNKTALLVIGGWNDIFVEGSIELFEKARSRWKSDEAMPDRLILGPWSHGNPTDWQGEEWLGYAAATVDLNETQLNFFDAAFGRSAPAGPMVRYFRSGSNTWHSASQWPLPGTSMQTLYLDCGQRLLRPKLTSAADAGYISDTLKPVPTLGGATFLPGLLLGRNSGPKDQGPIEARADLLVFTGEPLEEDTEVTGLVSAHVWVTSSAPTCDWVAKLCEVDAQGKSRGIVDGILRWRQTEDWRRGPVEVEIRLGHTSRMFRKGSRFRLQIASSNFPRFDRNPQSGIASTTATADDFATARQTIFSGDACQSRLVLPVVHPKSL